MGDDVIVDQVVQSVDGFTVEQMEVFHDILTTLENIGVSVDRVVLYLEVFLYLIFILVSGYVAWRVWKFIKSVLRSYIKFPM